VNNLLRESLREGERTSGLEAATYWLQVGRPNHYATTPQNSSNNSVLRLHDDARLNDELPFLCV